MAQERKIFVGGVPQDVTQDDLYSMFSEYAGVKKAWLQKYRIAENNCAPPHNHRGFGFVIFHDAQAIEDLLGKDSSRLLVLRNGVQVEIKRAVSSNKMNTKEPQHLDKIPSRPHAMRPYFPKVAPLGYPSQNLMSSRTFAAPPYMEMEPMSIPCVNLDCSTEDGFSQGPIFDLGGSVAKRSASPEKIIKRDAVQSESPCDPLLAAHVLGMWANIDSPPTGITPSTLKKSLVRFYKENRPEKLLNNQFIDAVCRLFEGRESELNEVLYQKYGQGLEGMPHKQNWSEPKPTPDELPGRPFHVADGVVAFMQHW